MRIALLTFHDTTNFGSFLQTYGLFKTLESIGIDCEILNYECEAIKRKELPARRPEAWNPKKILKFLLFEPIKRNKYKSMISEVNKYFKLSKRYVRQTIMQSADEYDAFLVGSDILWGLDITEGDTTYFLDFVKDKNKKFAFSTSVGNPWNSKEKEIVAPLLDDFSQIAVREYEAVEWIQELVDKRISVVCDPTMLLPKEQWRTFARQSHYYKEYQKKRYVLTYFGTKDGRLHRDAMNYAGSNDCEVWVINYGIPIRGCKNIKPTQIDEFLALVDNADAIFTASYHGMMFSIYFEKQFFYYNDNHPSRFDSVAERLGLTFLKRSSNGTFVEKAIDYKNVSKKVDEWREQSLQVLQGYWK
jgi:hypothetical protein